MMTDRGIWYRSVCGYCSENLRINGFRTWLAIDCTCLGQPKCVVEQFVNVELVFSQYSLELFVSRMVVFVLVQRRLLVDGVSILRVF